MNTVGSNSKIVIIDGMGELGQFGGRLFERIFLLDLVAVELLEDDESSSSSELLFESLSASWPELTIMVDSPDREIFR